MLESVDPRDRYNRRVVGTLAKEMWLMDDGSIVPVLLEFSAYGVGEWQPARGMVKGIREVIPAGAEVEIWLER